MAFWTGSSVKLQNEGEIVKSPKDAMSHFCKLVEY